MNNKANINYKISINCEGFLKEKKALIQEAFFNLGLTWAGISGDSIQYLHEDRYTNTFSNGTISSSRLMVDVTREVATHTFSELMILAGMEENITEWYDVCDGDTVLLETGFCWEEWKVSPSNDPNQQFEFLIRIVRNGATRYTNISTPFRFVRRSLVKNQERISSGLVVTDWRDLEVGDIIIPNPAHHQWRDDRVLGQECEIVELPIKFSHKDHATFWVKRPNSEVKHAIWSEGFKFVRRPNKSDQGIDWVVSQIAELNQQRIEINSKLHELGELLCQYTN